MAFGKGDVVQLKSGGPAMTIKKVYPDGSYACQWFVESNLQDGSFVSEMLKHADQPSSTGQARSEYDPHEIVRDD